MSVKIPGEQTAYGFKWGPVEVTRTIGDDRRGMVVVSLKSKKHSMDVYVMKGGKVRIFESGKEWKKS